MMGRRKTKKSRRRPSRGSLGYNKRSGIQSKKCSEKNASNCLSSNHDLNVPLPSVYNKPKLLKTMKEIVERLELLGYSTAAFSHTIYGQPDMTKDKSDISLGMIQDDEIKYQNKDSFDNKRKRENSQQQPETINKTKVKNDASIKLLKRLNVVIESLSDVPLYSGEDNPDKPEVNVLLNSYDIIAVSPRNDAVFGAVCSDAHACHVIVLDYTTGGRLPFRLKPVDVAAATKRGAVFEISYAPAIVNPDKRKYFIQTGREFFLSSTLQGIHASLIVSSGGRISSDMDGGDLGPLALRSPQDITNITEVLFGLDTSNKRHRSCLSSNPAKLLQQIIVKKSGKSYNVSARKPHSIQTLVVNSTSNYSSSILSIKNNDFLFENNTLTVEKHLSSAPLIGEHFHIMNPKCAVSENDGSKKDKEIALEKMDVVKVEVCDDLDDGFIAL